MRYIGDSLPEFFAGVVHVASGRSSRASISLLVQEDVLRRIPQCRNPKQRSRVPNVPQAPTTVTHRIVELLPLCLNLNEPQICRTRDSVYIFLYIKAYVEIRPLGTPKGSSSTHQSRAIFSRLTLAPVGDRYITVRCSHSASIFLRVKTLRKRILRCRMYNITVLSTINILVLL